MRASFEDYMEKETDGCGGRLMEKTGSFIKGKSRKLPNSSNSYTIDYMAPNEKSIDIMPQKTYIFWILILIIFFIATVNFTILIIMVSVLRIGEGIGSMEILSKEDVIKFYGVADFDYVLYGNGVLKGFQDTPMEVNGNESPVFLSTKNAADDGETKNMVINGDEISFPNIEKFYVVDPITRSNIFSTDNKEFKIPKGLPHLDVKKLRVKRLISAQNSNLTIQSDTIARLRGNEGVDVKGKEIAFIADGDIYLNSVNGSIYLLADNIKIDMKHVPFAYPQASSGTGYSKQPSKQYKLCVCMPHGYLFKVPILNNVKSHLACRFVDLSSISNPCARW